MKLARPLLSFAFSVSLSSAILVAAHTLGGCSSTTSTSEPQPTTGDSGADANVAADAALADADAATGDVVWPTDATKLVAYQAGGGFVPPAPDGSTCPVGRATYTYVAATHALSWTVCTPGDAGTDPYADVSGARTITASEVMALDTALAAVVVHAGGPSCGADKPSLSITVTDPRGDHDYTDSFYACMGMGKVYVDNIDGVFQALEGFAK